MKITLLIRVPFLDKIPSLKTLVVDLAQRGVDLTIISSVNEHYPVSDFSSYPNVRMILVKQRTRKVELPTSIKLILSAMFDMVFHKSNYYIGGDTAGCHLLMLIKRIISFKYINFVMEYPDIDNSNELREIEAADFIITHDHWHGEFISKHCKIKKDQMFYLPNASYTNEYHGRNKYLANRLHIPDEKNIVLHSGGLGKWFCCKELAESAVNWDSGNVLVFHTSHIVEGNKYYEEIKSLTGISGKVFFSTKPVPNEELDELVASAKIGIATYSLRELGYRAENMGLAAGKIGNYLKCGVPVIATRVHSLSYLEDYGCGVLIDSTDDISEAISVILADYDAYVANAYKCYRELWYPKNYLDSIFTRLSTK